MPVQNVVVYWPMKIHHAVVCSCWVLRWIRWLSSFVCLPHPFYRVLKAKLNQFQMKLGMKSIKRSSPHFLLFTPYANKNGFSSHLQATLVGPGSTFGNFERRVLQEDFVTKGVYKYVGVHSFYSFLHLKIEKLSL